MMAHNDAQQMLPSGPVSLSIPLVIKLSPKETLAPEEILHRLDVHRLPKGSRNLGKLKVAAPFSSAYKLQDCDIFAA